MEMFSEDKKETVLNLITHVEVEPSHNCDAPTLTPAIKSVKAQKMMPEVVLADRLCGSDDNTKKADDMAVYIVSEIMGGADDGVLQAFVCSKTDSLHLAPKGIFWRKSESEKID